VIKKQRAGDGAPAQNNKQNKDILRMKKVDFKAKAAAIQKKYEERGRMLAEPPTAAVPVVEDPITETPPAPAVNEHGEKVGQQLPLWPEDCAAMPTEITRVSLFRLVRRGRRKLMEDVPLESRSDVKVLYTGKDLDQADADLWLACLRIGRGVPMGQRIYTARNDLLREVGRNLSGANWAWLEQSLERMRKASLKATMRRTHTDEKGNKKQVEIIITTGLLKWGMEKPSGRMYIRLDPDGAALFDNLAYVPWETRLALPSAGAKSIHAYVCGHAKGKPHVVLLDDLRRWTGYDGRLRQFREDVCKPALAELEARGEIVAGSGKIEKTGKGLVVSWVRSPG
jgi:hypothetical protein